MNQDEAVEYFQHRAGTDRRQQARRAVDARTFHIEDAANAAKVRAADAIALRLSGREWDAETMGDVAEILLGAGYVIDGPDDEDDDADGHLAACDGFCGVPGGCGADQ